MDPNYDNSHLARDYISVVSVCKGPNQGHKNCRSAILGSAIDIPGFYREHNGLAGLKVKGVGIQARGIIELIMREGVKSARDTLAEERTNSIHTPTIRRYRTRGLPIEDPFLDNNRRFLEESR